MPSADIVTTMTGVAADKNAVAIESLRDDITRALIVGHGYAPICAIDATRAIKLEASHCMTRTASEIAETIAAA